MDDNIWEKLETLNVSSNLLTAFPEQLVRIVKLQKLYASDNQLTFEGAFFVLSNSFRYVECTCMHLLAWSLWSVCALDLYMCDEVVCKFNRSEWTFGMRWLPEGKPWLIA